eukprot:Amastigsp_a345183_48.p3 type:complete len:188 gc:universal Amastigsp_a345183_48:926-363(-)
MRCHCARVAREHGVVNKKQNGREPGEERPRAEAPPNGSGRDVSNCDVTMVRSNLRRVDELAHEHAVSEAPQLLTEDDNRGRDGHRRDEPPQAQHKHRKRLVHNHQRPRVRGKKKRHGEVVQPPGRRKHGRQHDNRVESGQAESATEPVRPVLLEAREVCNAVRVRLIDGRAVELEPRELVRDLRPGV